MFFIFSKLLEFFIYPFSWALILTITALWVKKPALKKKLFIVTAIVLVVFSLPIVMNLFAKMWDIKPVPLKKDTTYSCAIVLGGFSSELTSGTYYFNESADRFIQAIKLYQTGKVKRILVSGGNGSLFPSSFREADWVKTQLREFKVPDSCILIEDQSRNTIENASFSKKKLDSAHLQPPYVLVTSAFHMRRSLQIFKRARVNVVAYPCNFLTADGYVSIDDFIPDPNTMANWNIYTKEVLGTAVNYFR